MLAAFVRGLFLGELPADAILPYPRLSAGRRETLAVVQGALARFARDAIDPRRIDREHRIPDEVMSGLSELGLFGLVVPEERGGLGLDATQYASVCEDLARHDGAVAIMSGGHSTIGIKALLLFGTEDQKARYLPRLATGELKAAFALSEAGSGSDAQSLRTTARLEADGRHWRLDGTKLWCTNGGFADLFTVFARTPDHPVPGGRPSISCFLVERAFGVVSEKEEDKLGIRGSSTVPLLLDNVRVPAENLVGVAGEGFKIALAVLNGGRTGLSANCLGASRLLLEEAARYTEQRQQFGRPIARFELVQEKLGRCAQDVHALEALVFLVTGLMDSGVRDVALEAALCKVLGTETLWMVVNDAVQCAGGNGFTTDYPYERMLRDARVNMIFEGTNEILRVMVASAGLRALPADRDELRRRARGGEPPAPLPVPAELQSEAIALSLGVAGLAQGAAGVLLAHGEQVRDRQLLLAALADQALGLAVQAAVLSRAAAVPDELLLARGACRRWARRTRAAEDSLRDPDHALLLQTAAAVSAAGGLPGRRP